MEVNTNKTNAITKKMYKVAIEASTGTVTDVSQRLNITHGSVSLYLTKHSEIKDLLAKKRLSNVDRAEAEIFSQLEFNDDENLSSSANIRQKASQFILTRLGKAKGWVEKTEQEVEYKGESLKIIIEEKKPDGDTSSTQPETEPSV